MNDIIEERTLACASYIIEHNATVRDAAKHFSVGKSTVHKDMVTHLHRLSPVMFTAVREILDKNKAERHIRGGEATKHKYLSQKST